jgi:hypothetical protein
MKAIIEALPVSPLAVVRPAAGRDLLAALEAGGPLRMPDHLGAD